MHPSLNLCTGLESCVISDLKKGCEKGFSWTATFQLLLVYKQTVEETSGTLEKLTASYRGRLAGDICDCCHVKCL